MTGSATPSYSTLWASAAAAADSAAVKAETATNWTRLQDALGEFDLAHARLQEAVQIIHDDYASQSRRERAADA